MVILVAISDWCASLNTVSVIFTNFLFPDVENLGQATDLMGFHPVFY